MPIVLSPPSSFCAVSTVTLDGVAYRLRIRYDERLTSWYLDAWNAVTGSPIVKGARLVDGTPAGTGRPGLWPGALGAMPVGRGARLDNAEDLMSGRAVLVYYPAAEIPAFSAGGFSVSGEWTPRELGPLVWLDPSDMATLFVDSAGTVPVVATGDPVGRWKNKGTAGVTGDAVQTVSASRPIFDVVGGVSSLIFGGNSINLRASRTFDTTLETVFVMRRRSLAVNEWVPVISSSVSGGNPNPSGDWWYAGTHALNDVARVSARKGPSPQVIAVSPAGSFPSLGRFTYSARFSASEIAGELKTGSFSGASPGSLSPAGVLQVGGGSVDVEISDVFVFDRILTTAERTKLIGYLGAKYGI